MFKGHILVHVNRYGQTRTRQETKKPKRVEVSRYDDVPTLQGERMTVRPSQP